MPNFENMSPEEIALAFLDAEMIQFLRSDEELD